MKALSIKQPWAWAIIHAGKDIENRDWNDFNWKPENKVRGTIAIHASKSTPKAEYFYAMEEIKDILTENVFDQFRLINPIISLGAIIGTVEIVDCVSTYKSPWFFGEYGFVLANPRPLITPIPIRGALGFWEVPKDIEDQINAELI